MRGYEDTAPSAALTLPSGFTLPRAAKMVLHRLDDEPVEPYHFAELARLAPGVEGLLYLVTIGLEVSPPWSVMADGKFKTTNEYIEGCWHMLRTATEELPGLPVGTGFEDFFGAHDKQDLLRQHLCLSSVEQTQTCLCSTWSRHRRRHVACACRQCFDHAHSLCRASCAQILVTASR